MQNRFFPAAVGAVLALGLAACDRLGSAAPETAKPAASPARAADPVIARALHDPLMTDPDLAWRSQANAIVSYADSSALPVLEATPQAAQQAREAARLALLESGAIATLPPSQPGSGGAALGSKSDIRGVLAALAAPAACGAAIRSGFALAAQFEGPAAIMPQGMVEWAAGSDAPGCRLRMVRYLTAASAEDVLIFHHTMASRFGLPVQRFDRPEAILSARGSNGEAWHVHVRAGPGGMSAVDLVLWTR